MLIEAIRKVAALVGSGVRAQARVAASGTVVWGVASEPEFGYGTSDNPWMLFYGIGVLAM